MAFGNFLHGKFPVSQPYGNNNPRLEPLIYKASSEGGLWFNPAGREDAGHWHAGIDYACPTGTPLYVPVDGIVKFADFDRTGFGWCVQIFHGTVYTLYAHLYKTMCSPGEHVKEGFEFALTDSSGNSTAPHLHFAVFTMRDGWQVFHDPAPDLVPPHPSTLKPQEGQHGH